MIRDVKGLLATAGVVMMVTVAGCGATTSGSGGSTAGAAGAKPTTAASTAPASTQATPAKTSAAASGTGSASTVVHQSMTIETGKMLHKPNWPKYTPASWSVKAGDTVVLTIKSYDDGAAALPGESPYDRVLGTVGGTELVGGRAVSSIPAKQIAHTFTVPGLGLNVPIPVAPKGGTVTVQVTFKVPKAGKYDWQCEAPCGTTASGWGGPMETPGWMQGAITVQA